MHAGSGRPDNGKAQSLLFDVDETLLDLAALKESVGKALGGRPDLMQLWFTTMPQCSLVTTVLDRYSDFGDIGAACLKMLAKSHGVALDEDAAKVAVLAIRSLPRHADVFPALERLREDRYRLATLTNSSKAAVADQLKNAGLTLVFRVVAEHRGHRALQAAHPRLPLGRPPRRRGRVRMPARCRPRMGRSGGKVGRERTAFVARPGQQTFPLAPAPNIFIQTLKKLRESVGHADVVPDL